MVQWVNDLACLLGGASLVLGLAQWVKNPVSTQDPSCGVDHSCGSDLVPGPNAVSTAKKERNTIKYYLAEFLLWCRGLMI